MAYRKKSSGSETRKRAPVIGFRASENERATIQAAADRAGLTVGSYVRSRALSKPTTRAVRRPPVETAQLAQILGMLGALSWELQRTAAISTTGAAMSGEEFESILRDYRQAVAAIMKALGRRPHDH